VADVAVVVIHGMGSQSPDFAQPLIEQVNRRVQNRGHDPARIAWQPIFWADLLDGAELAYFRRANNRGDLDYLRLRRFVVTAFGDAVAYQPVASQHNTTYGDVHGRVREAIHELYVKGLGSRPKPLIVLAHSMGGHVISNYIWDAQKARDTSVPPFERMSWLAGIVTFGCNIPLFTFAYSQVEPIRFPPPQLREDLRGKARWLNFYDPDDILGYPLKPISEAYAAVVDRDIAIDAGGLFSSWNPLSHNGYWTDRDLTSPAAGLIASFL
jgi:hypothetical protein